MSTFTEEVDSFPKNVAFVGILFTLHLFLATLPIILCYPDICVYPAENLNFAMTSNVDVNTKYLQVTVSLFRQSTRYRYYHRYLLLICLKTGMSETEANSSMQDLTLIASPPKMS